MLHLSGMFKLSYLKDQELDAKLNLMLFILLEITTFASRIAD